MKYTHSSCYFNFFLWNNHHHACFFSSTTIPLVKKAPNPVISGQIPLINKAPKPHSQESMEKRPQIAPHQRGQLPEGSRGLFLVFVQSKQYAFKALMHHAVLSQFWEDHGWRYASPYPSKMKQESSVCNFNGRLRTRNSGQKYRWENRTSFFPLSLVSYVLSLYFCYTLSFN